MKYIPGDLSALPILDAYVPAFGIEKQKFTTVYAIKKIVSEIKNATKEDAKNEEKIYVVYDAVRDNTDVQLTGWALENGVFTNTGTGWDNRILINREYYHLRRKVVADFGSVTNGIIYFGYLSNVNQRSIQQSLFSVNFANNTLNIHDVPNNYQISAVYESVAFTPSTLGNKYRLEMTCPERGAVQIRLLDMTEYKVLATITKTFQFEIPQWGLMFDKPFIFGSVVGFTVNCFQVLATYSPNIRLQIIGDSITQGYYATSEQKSYPGLIANEIGDSKVVRSGRSGGNIDNVLDIVASETTVLKPEYVMVTIGTNGGNTLQKLTTLINNIVAAGAKPIINHIPVRSNGDQVSVNAMIDEAIAQNTNVVRCVRMDVATSKNYNISDGYDAAISYDGIHPNDIGHNRMYLQAKIDVPEIFG
jgi:lysophospholipase L1-like esterase